MSSFFQFEITSFFDIRTIYAYYNCIAECIFNSNSSSFHLTFLVYVACFHLMFIVINHFIYYEHEIDSNVHYYYISKHRDPKM